MMRLLLGIQFYALTYKKDSMQITLGKPLAVSDKGRRTNNEDAVFPSSELVSPNDRLYLVCDGVGGSNRGEVASALTCEVFHSFFQTFLTGIPDDQFVQKAIQYVETCFDKYITEHPDASAVFYGFNIQAKGGVNVFRKHGLRIGEDISVMLIGSPEWAYTGSNDFARLDMKELELGRKAAGLLLDLIMSGSYRPERVIQDCVLIKGTSVRKIQKEGR